MDALRIPYIAPSFGGCESIVDQPAIMSYWYVNVLFHGYLSIKYTLLWGENLETITFLSTLLTYRVLNENIVDNMLDLNCKTGILASLIEQSMASWITWSDLALEWKILKM